MSNLSLATDPRGVALLTLNRPEVHNAFDDALISSLLEALRRLSKDSSVRVLCLTGAGASFSAAMLRTLDEFPCPTLALVNGTAFGGGIGLVAACDIAIASTQARFSLSEVRLGLVPATISPYVIAAIGQRAARRFYLTGERFDANTAYLINLEHEVVPHDELQATGEKMMDTLLSGGPKAQAVAKNLIKETAPARDRDYLDAWTARLIAEIRQTDEAAEGLAAFFDKRPATWKT